ncbi:hypothetical protein, conserved [Leishmania donovani]|uniref:Uncharacterized protein n=1 Tax=Leishmania donovani TaxID=5661 RepID=E9BM10_LEIDO|nr:hypothetical protein, conserved [Leishmania donovani]TPP45819.1 hypothetical protein CGC21_36050 [Leishmania donovani]CBZ36288.1 hypothetical protein, conserved [Leishmania donovani]
MSDLASGSSRRPRAAGPLLASGILLLALLTVMCAPVSAEVVVAPLCAEKHGFAGEFNDHYTIPVEQAPAAGEAIVLIARAFPLNLGNMLARWLYINATYRISEGAQLTEVSDNNGILELANVAAGTDIEVRVMRVRTDGPTPFRFFSFFANSPVCHVAVAPDNSFIAPVPRRLRATPQLPLTMYFKAVLPPNVNALIIRVSADGRTDEKFRSGDKVYASGDLVRAASGGAVLFAYTFPMENAATPYYFTQVSVSYGEWEGGDAAKPSASNTSSSGGDSKDTMQPTRSTPVLRRLLLISLFLFLLYQAAVSAHNYYVLGKRDVMDIVPCAKSAAAGARTAQLVTLRFMGMSQRHKEGYNSLQNPDDPYS